MTIVAQVFTVVAVLMAVSLVFNPRNNTAQAIVAVGAAITVAILAVAFAVLALAG